MVKGEPFHIPSGCEIITFACHSVLRKLLKNVRSVDGPTLFSIIADEATDVASNE